MNAAVRRLLARVRLHLVGRVLPLLLRPRASTPLVRLGSGYGGWWIPRDFTGPGVVAYCAGAGEDITFDLALLEMGCEVVTFDPTPRAIAYVRSLAVQSDRFTFVPVGWWDEETELTFLAPGNPDHVSYSAVIDRGGSDTFVASVKPPAQLQRDLGHAGVDLIKMDIEGAEYAVISSLLSTGPRPGVLCVEFDQPQPIKKLLSAVGALRRAGYELARIEFLNYTFVKQQ